MSNGKPPNKVQQGQPSGQPPDPALIKQFLDNQTRELQVRQEEVALNRQQLTHSVDYAKEALNAQAADRKHSREEKRRGQRERMIFGVVFVVLLAVFLSYALYLGKDKIVEEGLKAIVYLGAGALGGYSARTLRDKEEKDETGDEPS